jgi:FAD/FMN-containing dehydrogenase
MLCGSRGTLAVLVEASLKLLPAPARRRALVFALPGWALADPARWAPIPRIEPAWLTVLGREHHGLVGGVPDTAAIAVVGLEDDGAWVDRQSAIVCDALGAPALTLEDADAIALRARVTDLPQSLGPVCLQFASPHVTPAALAPVADQIWMASAVFHAPSGGLWLATGAAAAEAVAVLGAHGFTLIDASPADAAAPLVPDAAAVPELRARLRAALDPHGVLDRGTRPS